MQRKYWYLVVGFIVTFLFVVACTCMCDVSEKNTDMDVDKTYSFEDITHGYLSDVKYITTDVNLAIDIDETLSSYMNSDYVLWKDSTGSNTHVKLYFANEKNEVLFAVVDLGNQNLIQILVDDTQYVFQKKSELK